MAIKIKAIIVKGNPKYINNDIAEAYYEEIKKFLLDNGATSVEFNSGKAYTIPDVHADLYVAHSRGCDRKEHMPKEKQNVFLCFGIEEGIIDPIDLKWQKEIWTKDTDEQPPKEHFKFIPAQKKAIVDLLNKIKKSKEDPTYIKWK